MKKYLSILLLACVFFACEDKKVITDDSSVSLSKAMGDVESEDFSKAVEKRKLVFPNDHGPHPDFRTEWWYFTGNLTILTEMIFNLKKVKSISLKYVSKAMIK